MTDDLWLGSTVACTPAPRTSCQSATAGRSADSRAMAWLMGCEEWAASEAARRRDRTPSPASALFAPETGWRRLVPTSRKLVVSAGDEPSPPRFLVRLWGGAGAS